MGLVLQASNRFWNKVTFVVQYSSLVSVVVLAGRGSGALSGRQVVSSILGRAGEARAGGSSSFRGGAGGGVGACAEACL